MAGVDQDGGRRGMSEEELARSDEALLLQVQDEQTELMPSVKGFIIILKSGGNPENVAAFFRSLAAYAGKITRSIKPDGTLTDRFVMTGPSIIRGCPFIILSCFNRGFEALEFVLVFTKARALAVQYGLEIEKVGETSSVRPVREAGFEAGTVCADEESGVEVPRSGRRITGIITLPDGKKSKIIAVVNDQFNNLSAEAIIFVMMAVCRSGRTGRALVEFVRASLDTNPRLLGLMAERQNRIGVNQVEIISVETVSAGDLETVMHGKKSFTVISVPEV